jgi:uncharacterized RDD family membrane protein YckC
LSEPSRETVLGIDNIPLDLPVAGLGSRVLAGIIDYLALGLASLLLLALAVAIGAAAGAGEATLVIAAIGLFLLHWGYFAAFEIAMGGRTPGKAAVGLRTVHRTGGAAGAWALVVRNLLRTVDLMVGVVLLALDPLARRLGDHVAGTLVVHARPVAPRPVLGRVPPGWGAREVSLAESLLARAAELEGDRAERLARRLLSWIERDAPEMLAAAGDPATLGAAPVDSLRRVLAAGEVHAAGGPG